MADSNSVLDALSLNVDTSITPLKRKKSEASLDRVLGVRGVDLKPSPKAIPVDVCLTTPDNKQKLAEVVLRFDLGDAVECNMEDDRWLRGTVVALHRRDTGGECYPYQVMVDDGNLIWVPSDSECVIRARRVLPKRSRREQHLCVEDAVSEQIDAVDPQRTLSAADFHHVLTEVVEKVARVMSEDARTELDDEDHAFVHRRVRRMVHPAPGASDAMMLTECRRDFKGAKPMRLRRHDHVVCCFGGERKWVSGNVHATSEDHAQMHGRTSIRYVHVMVDRPDMRLIAVPEDDCHMQRAATCN